MWLVPITTAYCTKMCRNNAARPAQSERTMRTYVWAALMMVAAIPAAALELALPTGAQRLAVRDMPLAHYDVPTGVFAEGRVPMEQVEGRVLRRTWRIGGAQTPLQILEPLRAQVLEDPDFEVLFQCHDRECGGFDFRFAIDVVPAPDMAVDIGDYVFVAAKGTGGRYLTILASRSGRAAFLQVVEVLPQGNSASAALQPRQEAPATAPVEAPSGDIAAQLQAKGSVVLWGLQFRSGAPDLNAGRYDSLKQLAEYMLDHPDQRVLLVGHTDNVGSLSANTNLSLARARAVEAQLKDQFGIPARRMDAAGAGFLAPMATNETAAGRETNRRVEVVLLPSG